MRAGWSVAGVTAMVVAGCVSVGALVPGSGNWMVEQETGGFITTLGNDTIALEQFVLRGNVLEVNAVTRAPRTMLRDVRLEFSDDGRLVSYETTDRRPDAAPGEFTSRTGFVTRGDSLVWTSTTGGQTRTFTHAAPAAPRAPFIPPLLSPYMVMARVAVAERDETVQVVSGGGGFDMRVTRPEPAWLAFAEPQLGTVRLRLDALWRTQEIDARASTLGSRATRVSSVDIPGWARAFAALDAAGRGLGILSPPDSVRASVGGAAVAIDYHRPSMRGRVIFGAVVPWNQVWRTGANQATAFTTDRDLLIGGTRVPAGSYTIWTIPSPAGWQLILNRQTGQWGTQYDPEHDLTHIPMRVETLSAPVEQFTIAITPRGQESELSFSWDQTRAVVGMRVAP